MFHVGSQFGVGFTVWNSARSASAGKKEAYLPHMTGSIRQWAGRLNALPIGFGRRYGLP